jgi:hypothetical protein
VPHSGWSICGEPPGSHPIVGIILVDGPASNTILIGASASQAKLVLSTRRRRRPAIGWHETLISVSHQFVGGVTEKSETLVVHFPITSSLSTFNPTVSGSPGRDASTVLLVNEYSHLLRRIPTPLEVFPLRCVNLGSEAWPVYHGGGLLPSSLNQKTWVLTRCSRAEATGKWGKRGVNRL